MSKLKNSNTSPFPGCIIFFTIIFVFGGLIVLYISVGLYQRNKIKNFTQVTPQKISSLYKKNENTNKINNKLSSIKKSIKAKSSVRTKFNVNEVNALMHKLSPLKKFTNTAYIKKITYKGIEIEMSLPVRGDFFGNKKRYLNGIFIMKPEIRKNTISLKILDIISKNNEVPKAFIKSLSSLDFFKLNTKNEDLLNIIRNISRIYTEKDYLIIETKI